MCCLLLGKLHVQQLRAGEGLRARTSRATVPQSLYLRCKSHAVQTAAAVQRVYAEGKCGPGARAPPAACPRSALRRAPMIPCCRVCPAHRSPCPHSCTARNETSCHVIAQTKTRNQFQKPRRSLKRTHVQSLTMGVLRSFLLSISSSSGAESDLLKSPEQARTTSSNLGNSDPRMGDCPPCDWAHLNSDPRMGDCACPDVSYRKTLSLTFQPGSPPTKMILYYTQKPSGRLPKFYSIRKFTTTIIHNP